MVNNVGKTTQVLSTQIGGQVVFSSIENVIVISGELGLGFLLFDSAGTLGVITSYTSNTDFTVRTYALSIDISTILSLSY